MGAKARNDITPEIRGAWIRAAKIVEGRGRSLSELIADAMEKDIVSAMRAISAFLPRETKADINHTGDVNLVSILGSLAGRAGHDSEVEEQPDSVRH